VSKITWAGSNETRELRAKNIFGLSSSRFTRLWGQIGEDNKLNDHLAVMPTMEAGIHASIDCIQKFYLHMGNMQIFVPVFFYNGWCGDSKDVKKVKGINFCRLMKAPRFKPLSFKTSGDSLLRALAIMENGDPCRSIPVGYFQQFIEENP
jgi:hypothetical protein